MPMQIVSTGNTFRVYDSSMRAYDQLPAQAYVVRFDPRSGFYLEKYVDINIAESKVYGVHNEKVQKVLRSFGAFNRSLGVILSGDKGIGKSLFAKLLAIEAMTRGLPLIVVDHFYAGIESFLESIDQEIIVMFDEFDKTFAEVNAEDGQASPQTGLLTLFDGMSGGKKLFVITCNSLHKLSEFLINRPGRFHYHFRFDYPNADEIREYMTDKIPTEMHGEIDAVIAFAARVRLNYDCLRAIAFELSTGLSFAEAIQDLNIMNMEEERFDVTLHFCNGASVTNRNCLLDMYSSNENYLYFSTKSGDTICCIHFVPGDSIFSYHTGESVIDVERLEVFPDEDISDNPNAKAMLDSGVQCMTFKRRGSPNLHYMV